MFLDFEIGSENEQRLQVLDVFGDAFRFMTIGLSDNNILGMAFL